MEIDVIFLTKTFNEDYYNMTKQAIESLLKSETDNVFNIIVVESEKNCNYKYDYNNCQTVLFEDEKFNYNKAVNLGLSHSKNFWVAWSNNDVVFEKNWLTNIQKTNEFINLELCSFSCYEPNSHKIHNVNFNDTGVSLGYRVMYELCGWFILTNKKVVEKIGGKLDERFVFWYQDNDYASILNKLNIPHFLVKNSIIYHKVSQSHNLLFDNKKLYTKDSVKIFNDKWIK